jgi:hypothetical protein
MKSHHETNSSTYDLAALREEWRELIYRIAATEYAQQEADLLMEQIAIDETGGNTQEEDSHFTKAEPKTLRVIRKTIRKRKLNQFVRYTLPKVGKVAAALLLVFYIGLTAAIAGVPSVRVRVLELLVNIEDEYTELSLKENPNASFDVPAEWSGSYYPSKIPKGFAISQILNMVQDSTVILSSESDKATRITFSELGEDAYTNLDTEDAIVSTKMVNGSPALFAVKGNIISVSWAKDNLYFILICEGLQEKDVLSISNSVVRIK